MRVRLFMKCSSNIWKDLLLVHISPPTGGPLTLLGDHRTSIYNSKKFSSELLVLTKWASLLPWPRFTCHFDLLSPTHLILICQTWVCFGRNRAQGHTRAWAHYRLWLSRWHAFSIPDLTVEMTLKLPMSLFKWRWYWQGYRICFQRMWGWQTFSMHLRLPCSLITLSGTWPNFLSPPLPTHT